jgi:hypothetical protein
MALCTRCGQQTEADEEFCRACGGYIADAYSVGAYSATASRASYAPPDSHAATEQPRWFPEPDSGPFRSPPGPGETPPGRYAPEPPAASDDRQLRYAPLPAEASGSTQSDRYADEPAGSALSPTGRLPEYGSAGSQDRSGYSREPDDYSWPSRSAPDAASDQFTWAAPDPLLDPLSDPLTGPQSGPIAPHVPDAYRGLTGSSGPYSAPGFDDYTGPGDRRSRYASPEPDPLTGPQSGPFAQGGPDSYGGLAGTSGPYSTPGPDAYAGLTGTSGPYSTPGPDAYAGLTGTSGPYSTPGPDAYAGPGGRNSPYPQPGPGAYAGPGAVDYSPGLSAPGTPSMPASARPASRDRRVRGDLRVNRRGQAVRDRRDAPPAPLRGEEGPRSRRWLILALGTAVLIIAAGIAYVLLGHRGTAGHAPPAANSRTTTPSAPAASSAPVSTVSGLVTIAPGAAAAPHEAAIAAFLNHYFRAINSHNYNAYQRLFSPELRSGLTAAAFSSGYGTTRDTAATLKSISVTTAGQIDALVTFTSHQQAADSPTNSTCTAWTISLYLSKSGHRYVLETPPAGYQPTFRSCS